MQPFVTSQEHATLARSVNVVHPASGTIAFSFKPTASATGRIRQIPSSSAPNLMNYADDNALPDVVQLHRSPVNNVALLPIEHRLTLRDNGKRKVARKRRRKQQSPVGAMPVEGSSCLETSAPPRIVINPPSQTDVSESYA